MPGMAHVVATTTLVDPEEEGVGISRVVVGDHVVQVRHGDPQDPAGAQHAPALAQAVLEDIGMQVLEDVRAVDRVE